MGSGAIGCVLGAELARHHDVLFLDGWADHVEAMRSDGLTVSYTDRSVTVPVRAALYEDAAAAEPGAAPDVVLLAVKSNETRRVLSSLAPVMGSSCVVSLQNGLNEDVIAACLGAERTIGAVVRFDGRLDGPARASQARGGGLVIGELDGARTGRVQRLAELLGSAVPVEISGRIRDVLWSKLVINCMINAVAAVSDLDLGAIAADEAVSAVCVAMAQEAVATASAAGIRLDEATLFTVPQTRLATGDGAALAAFTKGFRSAYRGSVDLQPSMLQDLRRGRPTEVRSLNGAVVDEARRHGLPVPMNELAIELVERVEQGDAEAGAALAGELRAELGRRSPSVTTNVRSEHDTCQ